MENRGQCCVVEVRVVPSVSVYGIDCQSDQETAANRSTICVFIPHSLLKQDSIEVRGRFVELRRV